jgi:1-acyl-sn-glycerol-3-phosphate acyltransferase
MFVAIYRWFSGRVWLARLLFIASFLLLGGYGAFIRFNEEISSLLPENKELRAMNEVLAHTQAGEQLVFTAQFQDSTFVERDSLIVLVQGFADLLQNRCGPWIDTLNLQTGGALAEELPLILSENLPLFLNERDYVTIDSLCRPERIRASLEAEKKILLSPASMVYKNMVASDPLGISGLVWKKLNRLKLDPNYDLYEQYLFSNDGRRLNFFLKPKLPASETGKNAAFLKELDVQLDSFMSVHPGLRLSYFGGPAVAAGNASQMRRDTIVTLSVTIALLMALSYYYFRRKRIPLLLLLPVAYGVACGLAVVRLWQGSISVIALGAGAIVMGIAIDYSVHFLSLLRDSGDRERTIRALQIPLTIGSFTTIAAFLSLRLVHLPLLRDLGLFAAASLSGAALCTLIFLPHFPLGISGKSIRRTSLYDRLSRWEPSRNKVLLIAILVITPIMAWWSFKVEFDDDLMHLNYLSPRLKQSEQELASVSSFTLSSAFVMGQGKDRELALQQLEKASSALDSFQEIGQIRNASNPSILIPSEKEQQKRIDRWKNYWTEERRNSVLNEVRKAASEQGFAGNAFAGFEEKINSTPAFLNKETKQTLSQLFPGGFAKASDGSSYAVAVLKPDLKYRSAVMQRLKAIPGVMVTDRQAGATQMVRVLNGDFQSIAWYSGFLVFFALLIAYGRIELAIISFLPMAISWVWILGLMAMLGIKFNIVNIIISTLIFGLGDDYSIFTLDGLIDRYRNENDHTASVRSAVYVSVSMVLIGLGTLLLARHPALRSIAAISVTGMLCVLFISQTLQPALFRWMIQARADKRFLPFTAWSFTKSVFAFSYFVTCSLILSVLGFILTKCWPFGKERGKLIFHQLIAWGNWSLLYIMANVRKRKFHTERLDFSRPAVYIANHSSFLDLLLVTAMNRRVVLLTNKWVYRSPVFGAVVRMAEYYPVADGVEDSLEPLRELVSRGYSIVVFPEGTRSGNGVIQRFHKGAFYIAQQLNLEVSPVVIHGASDTMSKGDWLLKDGQLNLFHYPRIQQKEESVVVSTDETPLSPPTEYNLRAKWFGKWYRTELGRIKSEFETPKYFRERLIRCYTYKGPVLEWYCRIKTRLENNYERLHQLLPKEGLILDLGCGYGFAAYMLHWSAPQRRFLGLDYDEEKISVAQALHLRDEQVQFQQADLRSFELPVANAMILSDVLHYLMPADQESLLNRCVASLEPGGMIILRDGVVELEKRQRFTAMTELFSTRLLGFNQTSNELHFISQKWIEGFAKRHALSLEVLDETRYTSNLTFVLRK